MVNTIKKYTYECIVHSAKASYEAANNIWGAVFALGATSMLGSIEFITGTSKIAFAVNGIATLIIYTAIAWMCLFILRAAFVAPFLLYAEKERKIEELFALIKAPPFRIEFSDTANSNNPIDMLPYTSRTNIGVNGIPSLSQYTFGFKVINQQPTSVKDVTAFAVRITYEGGSSIPIQIPLLLIKHSKNSDIIHPEDSVVIQFIQFLDEEPVGVIYGIQPVDPDILAHLQFIAKRNTICPQPSMVMAVPVLDGNDVPNYGIQKPTNGHTVYLDIAIYATDTKPTYARFSLTAPDKVCIQLVSQGLNLPEVK